MKTIKTFVGDLEVIKDATVHLADDSKLTIIIETLEMEFDFISNKENKETKFERDVIGNKWIWKLTNFDNSLGQGILVPVEIGTLHNNKLFATFFIWTPDVKSGRRIVNYVLYIKNEKDGGN